MSVSPEQNSLKPSPVPGPSTVTDTSGVTSSNSSATRIEIGSTVDEPEIFTEPEPESVVPAAGVEVSPSSSPHAAATSDKVTRITGNHSSRRLELRT